MGDCTRPSRQQIDKKSSTTERASPQGASFDTPKCGSPAPAKRMLRVLNAVTGLGEPHQVLRRSWRSPTTVHTDRPNVTSRLQGMSRQPQWARGRHNSAGQTDGWINEDSWPQAQIRQLRCPQALRPWIVGHLPEPRVAGGVPLHPRVLDLLVRPGDEVPPLDGSPRLRFEVRTRSTNHFGMPQRPPARLLSRPAP